MIRATRTMIGAVALAAQLMAGGFYVELGNPDANAEAKAKGAVLLVRVSGCHDAEHAPISAIAEGMVNGQRKSIPVNLIPLSTPGMYAAKRDWPETGTWAVSVVAKDADRTTSLLVQVDGNGAIKKTAKWLHRPPADSEVAAILNGTD